MDHAELPDGGLIPHPDIDRLLPTEYQQQALEDLAPITADLVTMQTEKGALDNLYSAAGTTLFDTGNEDEMITPGAVIVGPSGTRGALALNIEQFFSSTNYPSRNAYIHLKLPWRKTQYKMYYLRAEGYGMRASPSNVGQFIDIIWTGYLNNTSVINTSNYDGSGDLNPSQYISTNSPYNLYLRLGPLNPYYLTFTLHSIYVGNGGVLYPGDITISTSTSANL